MPVVHRESHPGEDVNVTSAAGGRQGSIHRHPDRRFDPVLSHPVPLLGRPGVDRCRMSTEASLRGAETSGQPWVGGASRTLAASRRTGTWTPPGIDSHRRKCREQAHVPAEQPSSSQEARLPPPHAHPRRPRHPECPPQQGPQQALRLSSHGSARPCCPGNTGSRPVRTSGRRHDMAAGPVPAPWWLTCW